MTVKRSHSGLRILSVLETIASHQPIGVTALAGLLDDDKSAVQRALMTLADAGWIRTVSELSTRWELTAHIVAVAHAAHGSNDLRQRARPILERLRDETGETVLLTLPDVKNFVVTEVIESRQMLRMVPPVGTLVAARGTATGHAILTFMNSDRQIALLGAEPDQQLMEVFAKTRTLGYAISEGEANPAATNLAAPIFESGGIPAAAIVVCAPRDRLSASQHEAIGEMIVKAAKELSR